MFGGLAWLEQVSTHRDLGAVLATVLPIWVFGAVIGLLLPRPKWLEAGASSSTVFFASPAGLFVRRLTILYHAAYILREVWSYFTTPGRFGAVLASPKILLSARDTSDVHTKHRRRHRKGSARPSMEATRSISEAVAPLKWYITDEDLEFYKERVERDLELPGGCWQHMMDKNLGDMRYSAWKRPLADGKTDYKSLTIAEDSTAEEFMDFYLDDNARAQWDSMISEHEVLENGDGRHRCQVVRWVRSFPFSFIKEREYIIARRVWRQDGCLYGITKAIPHPRAVDNPRIVRMDSFYSMWRSRTVPSASGRPACETILLHREDFKIPENMARFAVKHGMSGFLKKMGHGVAPFVQARRQRVDMFEPDPNAYGVGQIPNPPSFSMSRAASAQSAASYLTSVTEDDSSECSTPRWGARQRQSTGSRQGRPQKLVRRFGWMLAATCVAVMAGSGNR